MQEILNAVHVPDDAGERAEALGRMLARIPDGWGRWISCSRGWYSIVVDLDEQLRALFPAYELQQVKEKYGPAVLPQRGRVRDRPRRPPARDARPES